MDVVSAWVAPTLLLGLRIAPVFSFAPPFTLVRLPALVRVLMALGIAASLASGAFGPAPVIDLAPGPLLVSAVRELLLGTIFVLAFQLAFAALYVAGRTIDIQAGFGLALLIDPTSRSQTPLVGTLFAYAAGLIFFAADGHLQLIRLFAASLEAVPLGTARLPETVAPLAAFAGFAFSTALGAAGATILMLFVADLAIALLSRTVPQMNVLVLGFQVKTLLMLAVLALSFGVAAALIARLMAATLSAIPGLF